MVVIIIRVCELNVESVKDVYKRQCLISQTVDVKSGQSATVVITATTRNDVLILPLSVIAGRQGTGLVTVITPNGERVETKVTLGVTDGANIEILSGLEEGDVVSARCV